MLPASLSQTRIDISMLLVSYGHGHQPAKESPMSRRETQGVGDYDKVHSILFVVEPETRLRDQIKRPAVPKQARSNHQARVGGAKSRVSVGELESEEQDVVGRPVADRAVWL